METSIPAGLAENLAKGGFLVLLLDEEQYKSMLPGIAMSARGMENNKNKICYVCLNRQYDDALENLKKSGIDTCDFFFIDVLSSHYESQESRKKCIFLESPDVNALMQAIERFGEKEGCNILLVDTISALLAYHERFSILTFTHNLTANENWKDAKKVYLALKEDDVPEEEIKLLIEDLTMFADKMMDLSPKQGIYKQQSTK